MVYNNLPCNNDVTCPLDGRCPRCTAHDLLRQVRELTGRAKRAEQRSNAFQWALDQGWRYLLRPDAVGDLHLARFLKDSAKAGATDGGVTALWGRGDSDISIRKGLASAIQEAAHSDRWARPESWRGTGQALAVSEGQVIVVPSLAPHRARWCPSVSQLLDTWEAVEPEDVLAER